MDKAYPASPTLAYRACEEKGLAEEVRSGDLPEALVEGLNYIAEGLVGWARRIGGVSTQGPSGEGGGGH
ncbi:MAG: hypothetical protein DRJ97_08270 [Thermoprotei archaeon]|nr:MAG: hypothetical protein DRJ97_08270 [Thermoprotei archaeon]